MHKKGCDIMSPRTKKFTERINVFFSPEQMELINNECDRIGIGVSEFVRITTMREVNRVPMLISDKSEEIISYKAKCPSCDATWVSYNCNGYGEAHFCPVCGQAFK